MARNEQRKRIKITSRGMVLTSRGYCRTPILTPYMELVSVILPMISRDGATVVEVLDDKTEVELNAFNFSEKHEVVPAPKIEYKPVEEVPQVDMKKLSRSERRKLERQERQAKMMEAARIEAESAKEEEAVSDEIAPVESFEEVIPESSAVEADAISE